VEFQFISNGKSVFNLKPSELKNRISQVFAVHYHEKLIGVEAQDGSAKLTGFVGNLDLIRNRSGEQYLFVNNRLVNDRMMNSAVYQAFSPMIEKGEFPFFVLNLDLPASEIDVNVHPQKTEIKYHQDWFVYQFIRRTVAGVLEKNLTVVPTFNHNQRFPGNTLFSSEPGIQQQEIKISPLSGSAGYAPSDPVSSIPEPEPLPDGHPLKERIDLFSSNISRDRQITNTDNIISIWQAHNKYIFAQIASGIIVIDQHAAHERILFEKALTTFQNESARASQQLLFPVSLTVSPDDYSYFADLLHEFEQLGFSLREFGRNTLLIEAVPADLRHIGEGRIVLEILDFFKTRQTVKNRKQYNMAASYACKAAIKSGDLLQPREMQQLIDELFQTQTPYACPHGRPTIIHLTLDELDKRFHRT